MARREAWWSPDVYVWGEPALAAFGLKLHQIVCNFVVQHWWFGAIVGLIQMSLIAGRWSYEFWTNTAIVDEGQGLRVNWFDPKSICRTVQQCSYEQR